MRQPGHGIQCSAEHAVKKQTNAARPTPRSSLYINRYAMRRAAARTLRCNMSSPNTLRRTRAASHATALRRSAALLRCRRRSGQAVNSAHTGAAAAARAAHVLLSRLAEAEADARLTSAAHPRPFESPLRPLHNRKQCATLTTRAGVRAQAHNVHTRLHAHSTRAPGCTRTHAWGRARTLHLRARAR